MAGQSGNALYAKLGFEKCDIWSPNLGTAQRPYSIQYSEAYFIFKYGLLKVVYFSVSNTDLRCSAINSQRVRYCGDLIDLIYKSEIDVEFGGNLAPMIGGRWVGNVTYLWRRIYAVERRCS